MTPLRRFLLLGLALLAGCGINPVTGERELQFVSAAQELKIGAENYAPMRQSGCAWPVGGDDPEPRSRPAG